MNIIKRKTVKPISFLHEIINDESIFPPFHDAMKSKNNIAAMDIGCGFPTSLIVLNEKYNLSTAICIDEQTEEMVVQQTVTALNRLELSQTKSICELYFNMGGGCVKTVEEFDEIFSKYSFWGFDAGYALIKNKEKIDVLVCQNFLHLLSDKGEWENLLAQFKLNSKKEAIICLRVQKKEWFNYEIFKQVLSGHYDGTMFEFYVDDSWDHSYFINLR